jgi:hypothetical protein
MPVPFLFLTRVLIALMLVRRAAAAARPPAHLSVFSRSLCAHLYRFSCVLCCAFGFFPCSPPYRDLKVAFDELGTSLEDMVEICGSGIFPSDVIDVR